MNIKAAHLSEVSTYMHWCMGEVLENILALNMGIDIIESLNPKSKNQTVYYIIFIIFFQVL